MMYGNRTFNLESVVASSPMVSQNYTQQIQAVDAAVFNRENLNLGNLAQVVNVPEGDLVLDDLRPLDPPEPIGVSETNEEVEESPLEEEPADEPVQTDEETTADEVIETQPEDETEPEAKTRIKGGNVEFALPDWFKTRLVQGAGIFGLGAVAYVGYIVADKTGALDAAKKALSPSEKKPEADKTTE